MRDIKFRAFYKEENRIIYNIQNSYDYNTNNDCKGDNELCFGDYLNNERYEIMQYTGFKDKNNKEIYEGDILLVANGSICGEILFSKRVVKWVEENRGYNIFNFDNAYKPTHYYEVIGNIYENRDLLEAIKC